MDSKLRYSAWILIFPQTVDLPLQISINIGTWNNIKDSQMANPIYHCLGSFDLLLGVDILLSILLNGQNIGQTSEPIVKETTFGWVIMEPA